METIDFQTKTVSFRIPMTFQQVQAHCSRITYTPDRHRYNDPFHGAAVQYVMYNIAKK